MFRLLVVPVSIGILAFVLVYFISPAFVKEQDTVAHVAEFILNFSNSYFENMPSIIAGYVANLNLEIVALSAGIVLMIFVQLVVTIGSAFTRMIKWVITCLQNARRKEVTKDLPPIEMDPRYMREQPGKEILGRGIDSLDRD